MAAFTLAAAMQSNGWCAACAAPGRAPPHADSRRSRPPVVLDAFQGQTREGVRDGRPVRACVACRSASNLFLIPLLLTCLITATESSVNTYMFAAAHVAGC